MPATGPRWPPGLRRRRIWKKPRRTTNVIWNCSRRKLLSESDFIGFKAARDVAQAQLDSADDQVNVAKAAVDSAEEQLDRTTIVSPLTGTITRLNSELGERVLGTVQNAGTEIMTLSDLNQIEARVNVGEMDVVGIKPGQQARLEVDAFKDRKFTGVVTDVANSAVGSGSQSSAASSSSQSQQATQFQVRIRVNEKEPAFRPGMSVTAEIETEYRTNALTVPLASVTTRPMKSAPKIRWHQRRRHIRHQRGCGHKHCRGHEHRQDCGKKFAGRQIERGHQTNGCGFRGGRRPRESRGGEDRHL